MQIPKWLRNLFDVSDTAPDQSFPDLAALTRHIYETYGLEIVEHDPKGNARPWQRNEPTLLEDTLRLLGPTFYGPFSHHPIKLWIDRNPGGGSFGDGWLCIGEPQGDISILYRVFLHEATHASNEYRGWPYENRYCTRPGLDWQRDNRVWRHPRQQGQPPAPGDWETLPVDSRDVSTAPGEDLAESVRYFVHSVKNERAWLWPLDLNRPATFLWDTSPTRFIYVRDHFLTLPPEHPWYRRLAPDLEERIAAHLSE